MKATYVQGEAYIQARKQPDGKWRLYWAGTRNEIWPGELFYSAQEARMYWRVMKLKGLVPA